MVKKKNIIITSLAARFPVSEGWTLDILNSYVIRSLDLAGITLRGFGLNEELDQYYIPNIGTQFDFECMISDGHVGELCCRNMYGELRGLSDIQVLNDRCS